MQTEAGCEAIFTNCLERVRRKEFRGWDWGWDLLAIAKKLVSTSSHRALFISALDDIEGDISKPSEDGYISDYGLEQVALFKLALIDRFDGEDASHQFLHAHVQLDRVRMELIERSMRKGELEDAMSQIQAGIASSQQRRLRGLTHQYQALPVKLLQQKGDKTGVIEGARALWLDGGEEDNFELLHKIIPAPEWSAFVEGLIKDIRRPEQFAWLYAHENRWRDLMELVQSHRQASWLINPYRDQLESRFPDDVAALYEKFVDEILVRATGRSGYKQAVAYLRQMKKIGQTARAEALVHRIRTQYANRPALLDELNKASL